MIVTTKELFKQAYGKYAIGAYNINNLEQLVGLFRGNLGKTKANEDPCDNSKVLRLLFKFPAAHAAIRTNAFWKR